MKLNQAIYDGKSDYNNGTVLNIRQDGMTSFIGRIGLLIGKKTEQTDFYLNTSLFHEFAGDTKTVFEENNCDPKIVNQNFKDSWLELALGMNHHFDKNKMVYADIAISIGGDYKQEWKGNIGMRFNF